MCGWKFRLPPGEKYQPNLQPIKTNFLFYPPINKLQHKFDRLCVCVCVGCGGVGVCVGGGVCM